MTAKDLQRALASAEAGIGRSLISASTRASVRVKSWQPADDLGVRVGVDPSRSSRLAEAMTAAGSYSARDLDRLNQEWDVAGYFKTGLITLTSSRPSLLSLLAINSPTTLIHRVTLLFQSGGLPHAHRLASIHEGYPQRLSGYPPSAPQPHKLKVRVTQSMEAT